ncbi:MAG: nucleoside-triphosphatase [Chloroflexia bacterium]
MAHNLLLTGRPGIGKTTVVRRTLERLPSIERVGFTTDEIRGPKGRLGFLARRLDGQAVVLAHVSFQGPYRVGRYGVDIAAFEREILPALDPRREGPILYVVDEIGRMECFSAVFRSLAWALLDDDRPLLGTLALHGPEWVDRVRRREDVEIVEVTLANRDRLPEMLAERLRSWLQLG